MGEDPTMESMPEGQPYSHGENKKREKINSSDVFQNVANKPPNFIESETMSQKRKYRVRRKAGKHESPSDGGKYNQNFQTDNEGETHSMKRRKRSKKNEIEDMMNKSLTSEEKNDQDKKVKKKKSIERTRISQPMVVKNRTLL